MYMGILQQRGSYLFELHHGQSEEIDKLLLILADADSCYLSQALQRHVAKHWDI